MQKLTLLVLVAILQSASFAGLHFRICEADGINPYNGRDVMVGEKLVVYARCDSTNYAGGGVFVGGDSRNIASVCARDQDPNSINAAGSHFVNAGETARVIQWEDSVISGCDLYGSDILSVPGDWFVVDYFADGIGSAQLDFYDYSDSCDFPVSSLTIAQVTSRDVNDDGHVNNLDYSIFSSYFDTQNCADPNGCGRCDLDNDADVDFVDVLMMWDYWLCTDICEQPMDETLRYRIVDEFGENMISMLTNESRRFFVELDYTDANDVDVFDLEIIMDDVSLGIIDNRAIDPNNANYTAQMLAQPILLGGWANGYSQTQAISFWAASLSSINEGSVASFIYTCNSTELQRLRVQNRSSSSGGVIVYPASEDLVINSPTASQATESATEANSQSSITSESENIDIEALRYFLDNAYADSPDLQSSFTQQQWNDFRQDVLNNYYENYSN